MVNENPESENPEDEITDEDLLRGGKTFTMIYESMFEKEDIE